MQIDDDKQDGQCRGRDDRQDFRRVGRDVRDPEAFIELDGVDHDRLVAIEIDVLQTEVAVPVANSPLLLPRHECAGVARQPLVLDDASAHPLVDNVRTLFDLDVGAYLGIPLVTSGDAAILVDAYARGFESFTNDFEEPVFAMYPRLRELKDISHHTVEIHRLENDGDRMVREAMASLFEGGIDPMVVIRWKDLFAVLERAVDATETAAHILEGIAIKNA